jgi:protoporphyrinogen oxidase
MIYDFVIIGGGIAGVYCAYKLSFKYKILLIEKESYLGGRVLMKKWHGTDIKLGAGIGSPENETLLKLMSELSFPYKEHSGEIGFIDVNDKFDQRKFTQKIKDKISEYQTLNKPYQHQSVIEFLRTNFTRHEVVEYLSHCEYIDFINSDIDYYIKNYPIDDNIPEPYKVLYIDWMKLIDVMRIKIEENQGKIILNCEVTKINKTLTGFKINCPNMDFTGNKIVLALTLKPLQKLLKFPVTKYIGSVPFVRIYTFHKSGHNFRGPNIKGFTILKDNYLQKVIIMGENILMASYSDSFYADYWKKYMNNKEKLKEKVLKYLRNVVPSTTDIDDIEIQFWSEGVHYYLPTNGKFDEIHKKIINPEENIYVCGEIVSRRQGWVDGSLSSVDDLHLI